MHRELVESSDRSEGARFDPPLHRQSWRVLRESSWAGFVADARARWVPGPAAFDRVLWHGGLRLGRHPLDPEKPPKGVAAGELVVAWGFASEPEVPPFDPAARLLLDEAGLVAVDKPAWLPMQRPRATARLALEPWLRRALDAPGLVAVHRLDRQTSGVALFARTPQVARDLHRALARRRVHKRYEARVVGRPAWRGCLGQGWQVRGSHASRFRFELTPSPGAEARSCEARFRVVAAGAAEARVEARPRTGRTHQLRVQLAALGHPIVGDTLYGAPPTGGRIWLHATELAFPFRGEALRISAPPPPGLWDDRPAPSPSAPGCARSAGCAGRTGDGVFGTGVRPGDWPLRPG